MIRLTSIPSKRPNVPSLVLIPGGPGLSSNTLRSLDILTRSFSLHYVDFPGCAGVPTEATVTFESLSAELAVEVRKIQGPSYLLGHSFGAYFAANVLLNEPSILGGVFLSAPFSQSSLKEVSENYEKHKTTNLASVEGKWLSTKTDRAFADYCAACGPFYFVEPNQERGAEMLRKEHCSAALFLALRSHPGVTTYLSKLALSKKRKILIAAESDGLFSASTLKNDAAQGGLEFHVVKDASHFVMFDQPDAVARLVERVLTKE